MRRAFRLVLASAIGGLVFAAAPADGQWSTDAGVNTAVATGSDSQVLPKIAVGPDGSVFVSWFQLVGGNYNVYMQRFSPAGVAQWGPGGALVSDRPSQSSLVDYSLAADSSGGAVVVFTDVRDGGDLDVFAYRLDAAGQRVWGTPANGVQLSANTNFEADPRVVQNSDGNFVFVWPRTGTPNPGLVMQILSPAGVPLLDPAGVVVAGNGTESPAFVEMVAADDGSVIIVYLRDTRAFSSPRHVRTQKLSRTGQPLWNAGQPVIINDVISVPIAHRPRIISDGAGGAALAWHDTRRAGSFDAYVQRVNAAGQIQFPASGLSVSTDTSLIHLEPAITFVPGGDLVIAWDIRTPSQALRGIAAQRIDAKGTRLWTGAGSTLIATSAQTTLFPRIVPAGDTAAPGVATVLCLDTPGTLSNRVLAMRIDNDGSLLWSGSPLVVSSVSSDKGRLPVALAPDGGILAAWEDGRAGNPDVYAQRINPFGVLGPACPADFNTDGVADINDFFAFLSAFAANSARADSNADGTVDISDFFVFLSQFSIGC